MWQFFAASVNTPLKPPTSNKENQQPNGLSGRKTSVSAQGSTPGGYGLASPSAIRGPGRRREASESYPFPNALTSPTNTFDRNEQRTSSPPPSLQRRRTGLNASDKPDRSGDADDRGTPGGFGSLRRHQTGPLSAGLGGPSSPWTNAPQSAGLSPMGSFGNFGLGQAQTDKRPGLGGRAESRFKNMLSKDAGEDSGSRTVERKPSLTSSSRLMEGDSWRGQQPLDLASAPLDETEEDMPSGSAALAADTDISPSHQRQGVVRGLGTPNRGGTQDEVGFGAFGMTSDLPHGFSESYAQQTPGQHRQPGGNEAMSPTDTNPYQSPESRGIESLVQDHEGDNGDIPTGQLPGLGGYPGDQSQHLGSLGGLGALPNLGRQGGIGTASDRSQTSSAGPNRQFPGLGGLGMPGAAAWPATHGGLGTPTRTTAGLSSAFGGGIFATSTNDMQSPGLPGLGGLGPQGVMGGSRMASMFAPSMQEQMRPGEHEREDRAGYQGFMGQLDQQSHDQHTDRDLSSDQDSSPFGASGQSSQPVPPTPSSMTTNQPPPPQQRTMVMPDRMRWIYRDPQGQTQGPWSGLEMHDWYKAGFFSPELLVKKYEDPDYEPLAQLIRRIGNSREPFLVPQIGIPHGVPGSAWAGGVGTPSLREGTQPPFANSFPSFGTTLTAEQQNALERRKQEEQYLMARQKEHLAQQQMAQRMHLPMQPGQGGLLPAGGSLQHHASAQSLHSQASFGSLASPNAGPVGFQPSPLQAAQGPFFGNQLGSVGAGVDNLGHIREEEIPGIMDRIDRAPPAQFGAPGQPMQSPSSSEHGAQIQQMLEDRSRLQQEQAFYNAQQQQQQETEQQPDRLREFQQLQGQHAGLEPRFQGGMSKPEEQSSSSIGSPQRERTPPQELSLTEQVQKAASVQQSPVQPPPQAQSGLPQPFPPAPSQSPLPAPAAQRTGRQSVADQLQRDREDSPSVETPSSAAIAPWAKEPAEASKGPSLKEIQEMEARQAAEAEAIASAARREAFQREMEAQAQQGHAAVPAAPGLPAGASWAAPVDASPSNGSPWAKAAQKAELKQPAAKTLAQIQKEEEARKRRAAAAAAPVAALPSPAAGAKSYANLAGKVSMPAPSAGSAWTTVGAGGKPKTPAAAPVPPPARATSSGVVPTVARKLPSRSQTMTGTGIGNVNAQEEFRKWAVGELRGDLGKGIQGSPFPARYRTIHADFLC